MGFYLIVKFYKMQARVVHRGNIAQEFPQAGLYHNIFPYVSWEVWEVWELSLSKVCANLIGCGAVLDIYI